MAVFIAHSDESAAQNEKRTYFVGGFALSEEDLPGFANAWRERVLDGPPYIPYLHMRQIRDPRWRQEHGLTWLQAQGRIDEAVRIIVSLGRRCAVISRIQRVDLEEVMHTACRERGIDPVVGLDEPDYFCFVAYARVILEFIHRKFREATKVNFIVSATSAKIEKHLQAIHGDMKQMTEPNVAQLLGEFEPITMKDCLPLQAADVLCWHFQRYYRSERMERIDETRLALLGESIGHNHDWSREDLEGMATRLFKPH